MTLGDLADEGKIELAKTTAIAPLLQYDPKGIWLRCANSQLHSKSFRKMSLITCEVIALIISVCQDDGKHTHAYVFYSVDSANKSNNNMTLPSSFLIPSESLLPTIAAAFFLIFSIYILVKDEQSVKNSWIFPAALSILFLLFSLKAIASEGGASQLGTE